MTMAKNKYGGLCTPRHGAAIGPRGAGFVWWFGIAHRTRTAIASIDSEWLQAGWSINGRRATIKAAVLPARIFYF